MLRLTLDLFPHGEESNQETLGVIEIVNDGTGTDDIGNYKIFFTDKDGNQTELDRVLGHKRPQKNGAWVVCREAMKIVLAKMRKE